MNGRTGNTVLRASRRQVRPPRKVSPFRIEADHIGGRNHIPHITVDEYQPDHVGLTEARLAAGAEMKKQRNKIKTVEMALRSLAVTGHADARRIDKLSEALEFCAETLKKTERRRRKGRNRRGRQA
jgi:hypothetical protein